MTKGIIFDFNGTLFWDSQLHYDGESFLKNFVATNSLMTR